MYSVIYQWRYYNAGMLYPGQYKCDFVAKFDLYENAELFIKNFAKMHNMHSIKINTSEIPELYMEFYNIVNITSYSESEHRLLLFKTDDVSKFDLSLPEINYI